VKRPLPEGEKNQQARVVHTTLDDTTRNVVAQAQHARSTR
jgi:hypothetical protein